MDSLIVSLICFDYWLIFSYSSNFRLSKVIDSVIYEAREIFEHKKDIKNETVEEETSTEEIPEQAAEETDSNNDATFSEVSKELEDNLSRKAVPQFFANFIEHCIAVGISFFSCLFWNFFSTGFFLNCLSDVF